VEYVYFNGHPNAYISFAFGGWEYKISSPKKDRVEASSTLSKTIDVLLLALMRDVNTR
jgi:hypothetical protein